MENLELDSLKDEDLVFINGGSWLSDKMCYLFGAMFMTSGMMAVEGNAAETHSY